MTRANLPRGTASSQSRREFLKSTALVAGAAALGAPYIGRSQEQVKKLNIAVIGAAGKGQGDTDICSGENIVALCDVDTKRQAVMQQRNKYPNAKFYPDFRKMLEELDKSIDAVIVATPDHIHASAASLALQMGKHVYCQKPLAQTVFEARYLRDLAKQKNLVTQMGNQGSAADGLRRAVECIQAGLIGPVRQVYVWSNRPIWPQGMDRPAGEDPVPEGLEWDLWLGPAQSRPYKNNAYVDFKWRGWQDFGTGALGDMACHTTNLPFRALKLGFPTEIEAEPSVVGKDSYPLASKIRFQFPAREGMEPLTFWWFDGGKAFEAGARGRMNSGIHDGSNKPPKEVTADVEELQGQVPGSGCLMIGDKGKIFSPDDYGTQFFLKLGNEGKFAAARNRSSGVEHEAVAAIPQTIPRNATQGGDDPRQHLEWIAAIKANKPEMCYSRFDVAAYLTEIILLGCVSLRVGKKLDWDGPNMVAKNAPEAAAIVKRQFRSGWKLA